jgi:uncharacterized membrane protein HdeD (DUF308 family)
VVLLARPTIGALTLALLFGLYNLIFGTSQIIQGIELRAVGRTARSLDTPTKEHATV